MKKLFLISSFTGCMSFMLQAQINKMYKTTSAPTTQTRTTNNVKIANQNSGVNNPESSYRGMINISPDINLKMETEWNVSANQFGGNQLKAELWSVVYQPEPNKPNNTQIILQQRIPSSNLSYQAVAGGVSYFLNSFPPANNLAVILYSNTLRSAPGLVIKGKPDDGKQAPLRHYESNAQSKLGQNIIYAIYSIVPGKTDLNHLDFSFFMPTNIQSGSLTDSSYYTNNFKEPEYRVMQNLRLINVGPAQCTAAVDLICYNPNDFGLQVTSANGNIYINSTLFGQFELSNKVQVEKNSGFTLPALIKANTMEALKNQNVLFKMNEALVKIEGTAIVNIAGISKKILIEYESYQNVEKFKIIVSH